MASKTGIEYVDATWNPWSGCAPVSPGCANCYAKRMATRFGRDFSKVVRAPDKRFYAPLHWKTPKRILACSMSDFFHHEANAWRDEAWAVIRSTPQHTYLLLTKRPKNVCRDKRRRVVAARKSALPLLKRPWVNVWLGATAENQPWLEKRWGHQSLTRRPLWFLSLEPLLGPIDFEQAAVKVFGWNLKGNHRWRTYVDWVIVGGESGPGARPMEADWARSIRDQCKAAGVPFFMKQMSKRAPIPKDLQIREYPK